MAKTQNVVDNIADKGRAGDRLVGHLTPGDTVIPKEILTPELRATLRKHFASNKSRVEQYTAGHEENSINPKTGMPEFGFFDSLKKSVTKPFKDIGTLVTDPSLKNLENVGHDVLPVAETLGATALGVPLPLAAAGVSGINSYAHGDGLGKSLLSAGEAGALSYGGQQLAGAAANQFPETASSISNAIPDLGISSSLQSLQNSLPDLGIGNTLSSIGSGVSDALGISSPAGAATSASGTGGGSLGASQPGAAATAAPASVGGSLPDLNLDTSGLDNFTAANATGDPASVSPSANPSGSSPNLSSAAGTSVATDTLGQGNSLQDMFTNANQSVLASGGTSGPSVASPSSPTASSGSNFISHPSLSSFGNMLASNPAAVIGAGGLAASALEGGKMAKGQRQIQQEAGQLGQQGQQLQNYLNTGTLPPGVQSSINQAAEAQKASIRSRYAQMGGSGSSSMEQELAAVDSWSQGQGASTALKLLDTGINESGLASQLYQQIANTALSQDQELGTAIGRFASSLNSGSRSALPTGG